MLNLWSDNTQIHGCAIKKEMIELLYGNHDTGQFFSNQLTG